MHFSSRTPGAVSNLLEDSFKKYAKPYTSALFRRSRFADEPTQPHLCTLPSESLRRRANAAAPLVRRRRRPSRDPCSLPDPPARTTTSPIPDGVGLSPSTTTPRPVGRRIGSGISADQSIGSTIEISTSPPSRDLRPKELLALSIVDTLLPRLCDGGLIRLGWDSVSRRIQRLGEGSGHQVGETDVDDSLPDWAWRPSCRIGVPSETEGFLALEGVYHTGTVSETEESNDLGDESIVEYDTWVQSSCDNVHVYDFHIAYSFSYKVPVLYFQGHQADGQLLTIDEIKKDLPSHSLKILSESKWTFITREEHPHLSCPWFTLHPCGTSDWMKLLLDKLGDKDRSLQYLSAWLSVVGQAVGLKIPLKLYCSS